MTPTLAELGALLHNATHPAAVFGPLAGAGQAALRRRYRELAAAVHPDRHPAAPDEAAAAFKALQRWRALAERQLASGVYGQAPRMTATVRGRSYEGYGEPIRGDLCDLFTAFREGEALLLKLPRNPRNNDLLAAEAAALGRIDRELGAQRVRAHVPSLVDAFQLTDSAGARRRVHALKLETGTLSLAAVLRARPQGFHPADAAWIFNRVLAALGATHGIGLVHGAVHLDHILVRPADHNAILIDWCYSVEAGSSLRAICPPHAADYPPEATARRPVTPATDLYMAARTLVRLLGGHGDAETLPPEVPPAMAALLRSCLIAAPHRRPTDAWELFDAFQAILREHYGPPTFRPFPLTAQNKEHV